MTTWVSVPLMVCTLRVTSTLPRETDPLTRFFQLIFQIGVCPRHTGGILQKTMVYRTQLDGDLPCFQSSDGSRPYPVMLQTALSCGCIS